MKTSTISASAARWGMGLLWVIAFLVLMAGDAVAHGVTEGDKGYIQEITGVHLISFLYLGAKHMVTGYDHILFLFGVVFFLYRLKHVGIYVSLFALGHSTTMLAGGFFNIGAFQRWFGVQPSTKAATLIFGLFHGFGLSTKLLDYDIAPDGLFPNLLAFNVGVEIGQFLALAVILIAMGFWRRTTSFGQHAYAANVVLMCAGFILIGYQLTGYLVA